MSQTRLRPGRVMPVLTVGALLLGLAPVSCALAAEEYVRATVDQDGQLRILTTGSQTIEPAKDGEQVGFTRPQISPDGAAVGWLAEYPYCCTSYPIPLKLMIRTKGGLRAFGGAGLPIWHWGFQAGGTQVAFKQETVHGGVSVHYELRDVATGDVLAEYDPPVGPDNRAPRVKDVFQRVAELEARR